MMEGSVTMGRFLNGVLIGVGIGLLVAPMKGEEMRRLVSERYGVLRSNLPDNEQLKQAGQQVAAVTTQTAGQLKDYAQQAASQMKATGSSLGDLAQQAATNVKQTGQDVADATKQAATSLKPGGQQSNTTVEEEPDLYR
jgi:gas vesicle protein